MALFAKWLETTVGSAAAPITTTIASNKFMGFYVSDSATSGTAVGYYMRLYPTGAGGGGCAGRFYCDLAGVAGNGGSGIQATCGLGESTSAGSVTGLGTGVYANVFFPNATVTGGTYAAVNAELYSGGASTVISATSSSFIRFSNQGGATTAIDSTAYLFSLVGFTSGASSTYYDKGSAITGTIVGTLKILTPAGVRYIPTYGSLS